MDSELLVSITLERKQLQSQFQKVGLRQSMAISVVSLAFVWGENMQNLTIAIGAAAPTVVTLDSINPARLSNQIDLIDIAIAPIDDIRATAKYRIRVIKNLILEFLRQH
jgi:CO/xanthine dehydrogenase FAD-binding subunit